MVAKKKGVFGELLDLSKGLALWQNQAIRLLLQKGALSKEDMDEITRIASIEYGMIRDPKAVLPQKLQASELPSPPQSGEQVYLSSIRDVVNVNALTTGQRLSFSKGLTVIYGENGSGKSSYARIMKKAFRAREGGVDDILPNVYLQATPGPATASFTFDEGGATTSEKWTDGQETTDRFGRFAVLDSKCARLMIIKESTPSFQPYGLDIFGSLAAVTGEVKNTFLGIAKEKKPDPVVLAPFQDKTSCGIFVAGINAGTSLSELESRSTFSDDEAKILAVKREDLKALNTNSPETIRALLEQEKKCVAAVKKTITPLFDAISDQKLGAFKALREELVRLENAKKIASERLHRDGDLGGVGGDVWRELMKAAEKYSSSSAYPDLTFPVRADGVRCVLCQQPIQGEAQERLERFWAFIQDETARKAEEARCQLSTALGLFSRLPKSMPAEIQGYESSFPMCRLDLFSQMGLFYKEVAERVALVESYHATGQWVARDGNLPLLPDLFSKADAVLAQKLVDAKDDKAVTEHISALEKEICEAESKQRLAENARVVAAYLSSLKISAQAQDAASKIHTRGITEKASALQKELVTDQFNRLVSSEIGRLLPDGLPAVVAGRPEKASMFLRVAVAGVKGPPVSPDLVFSEGERTAIALACFLSELATNKDNCGIIFDDPVSSFDHRIRSNVVDRLVEEAKSRQVIVLTHDLVFLTELMESVNVNAVEHLVEVVETYEGVVGLLTVDVPWHAAPVTRRLQVLDETVALARRSADAGDIVKSKALLEQAMSRLRSTWERAVEEMLFCKVIERYSRKVQTMRLDAVAIDDESVELIFKGMTATSKLIAAHDGPTEEGKPSLTSGDIVSQLAAIREFVTKQDAKNKDARKKRAHLKMDQAFR